MEMSFEKFATEALAFIYMVTYQDSRGVHPYYIGCCTMREFHRMADMPKAAKLHFNRAEFASYKATAKVVLLDHCDNVDEIKRAKMTNWYRTLGEPMYVWGIDKERQKPGPKTRAVICNETGEVFESAADACAHFEASPSNMSLHLRGTGAVRSIKGYTFSYV